jgi:hypothetical protein
VKERLKLVAANQMLQAHIRQLRQSANIEITESAVEDATVAEEPAPAGSDEETANTEPAAE